MSAVVLFRSKNKMVDEEDELETYLKKISPIYIDCHCHIAAEEFDQDLEDVVLQAKKEGVRAILGVTEFFSEFPKMLQLAERFPRFIAPCLGVHPVQGVPPDGQRSAVVEDFSSEVEGFIKENIDHIFALGEVSGMIACMVALWSFGKEKTLFTSSEFSPFPKLGEPPCSLVVGLDFTPFYHKDKASKEEQRQVFIKQIQLAKELDLPVNVHSRSAGRPTVELLKSQGAEKVLLHAFDGKVSVAMQGVHAGYFFSIPPSVVRSEQKQKLIKSIPLSNLLLETDAPALGPEKMARNEPRNIIISCENIAKIKGVCIETVMEETTKNALKLFPKLRRILKL